MSENNQSSYRSIFKATSLFGGVQVYQILIQIIKSKFVAVLLGPAGVGIMGLYQSGLQLVQQISSMGLAQSAVRDVSEANGSNDLQRIAKTVTVVRKLVWFTGLLGLIIVACCSPLLSKASFGNYDYTIPFIILSITLLLDQLNAGQRVVLQGMRQLKDLAKCTAFGVTFGLITSVPLYYWLGIDGIIPTLILNSVCSLALSWLYSRKMKIEKVQVTPKQTFEQGKQMLIMGISMSLSGIFASVVSYAIRGFIRGNGGVEQVGLFQAGFVIMTTYVGMVMNAIATDYYPRLAAINKDNAKCREAVSQQGEVAVMILAPMLTFCLVFMPFVLKILYSNSFLAANEYISWACLGMMLRLAAWVISYLFVAKAESKLFLKIELSANVYYLVFSLLGYKYLGLIGLGLAFALEYVVYFLQCYFIARKRYEFRFSDSFIKCYGIQLLLVVTCLAVVMLFEGWLKYSLGCGIIVISSFLGIQGLNQRMNFLAFVKNKITKK
ncbi:MAG: O-antigen translocase [Bacteroidaceae bacterium]|nr:O-antigen translocase [Bacteroidaceae bacterium]